MRCACAEGRATRYDKWEPGGGECVSKVSCAKLEMDCVMDSIAAKGCHEYRHQ